MSEGTCCAHARVVLKHTDHPNGTRSDYWECDYGCGQRFFPHPPGEKLCDCDACQCWGEGTCSMGIEINPEDI